MMKKQEKSGNPRKNDEGDEEKETKEKNLEHFERDLELGSGAESQFSGFLEINGIQWKI